MASDQLGFNFESQGSVIADPFQPDALAVWRAARREAMERLAKKQGLPLGQRVRVEFACGPPLEGLLLLNEEMLLVKDRSDPKLHLRIGTADFHADEISACVQVE